MNGKNMVSPSTSWHFFCRKVTSGYTAQEWNENMELEDRVPLRLFSYCTISEKTKNRLALQADWLTDLLDHFSWQISCSQPVWNSSVAMDLLFFISQNGFPSYDYNNIFLSRPMRVCYPHNLHVSCVGCFNKKKIVKKHCSRPLISNFYNSAGYVEIP